MSDEPRIPEPEFDFNSVEPIPLEFPPRGTDAKQPPLTSFDTPAPVKKSWREKLFGSPPQNKPKRPKLPKREPKGGLKPALEQIYMLVGMGLMPVRPTVGKAIIEAAPECAESLVKYAETNPAFKRFLINFVSTSDLGKVIAAHAPIFIAIAMELPIVRKKQMEAVEHFANNPGAFPFVGLFKETPAEETEE